MKQKPEHYRRILHNDPLYREAIKIYEKSNSISSVEEQVYVYVMLPTLLAFVRWILGMAKDSGKKRLYFLARDGYQMYLAAQYFCEYAKLDIDCRYLAVSRYALRRPEYHLLTMDEILQRICIGGIDVTFHKIMQRGGLTEEEGKKIAKQSGWEERYDDVLTYRQVMALRQELLDIKGLEEIIRQHSQICYDSTIGYLRQEGLLDDIDYAIVDSGWVGTMQQTLQNLLQSVDAERGVEGYYFGLYETPRHIAPDKYHAYYFSPKGDILDKIHFSNCLFEAIITAPTGMTCGYEMKEGRYEPVLDLVCNPNKTSLDHNIDILHRFMKCNKELLQNCLKYSDGKKTVARLLKAFMAEPAPQEVEAYGNHLFSDDVLEGAMQEVAAVLSEEEIRRQRFFHKLLIMTGIKKEVIHESAWIEGSIVRCGKHVRQNLRHAGWYKCFVYVRKTIQYYI